jgi:hypothetical protein
MDYKDMVAEVGQEFAAALLEEEYNQFIRGLNGPAADFYPFDAIDCYTDFVETIGHGRIKANHALLYRMAEGV